MTDFFGRSLSTVRLTCRLMLVVLFGDGGICHFHTPTSFDYENGAVTNEQIVEGLKKAGVSVVAITDHHVIDVTRIRALQKLAGNDLTVLPGIEFRTELGGKEKVHLIGIFSEDSNLDDLWTKLSGKAEARNGCRRSCEARLPAPGWDYKEFEHTAILASNSK